MKCSECQIELGAIHALTKYCADCKIIVKKRYSTEYKKTDNYKKWRKKYSQTHEFKQKNLKHANKYHKTRKKEWDSLTKAEQNKRIQYRAMEILKELN